LIFSEEPFKQKCDVYSGLYFEGISRYDCFLGDAFMLDGVSNTCC